MKYLDTLDLYKNSRRISKLDLESFQRFQQDIRNKKKRMECRDWSSAFMDSWVLHLYYVRLKAGRSWSFLSLNLTLAHFTSANHTDAENAQLKPKIFMFHAFVVSDYWISTWWGTTFANIYLKKNHDAFLILKWLQVVSWCYQLVLYYWKDKNSKK